MGYSSNGRSILWYTYFVTDSKLEDELRELDAQRSLLDLTPEQRAGLKVFLKRQPTVRETWTSREFLYGRLLLSAFSFGLGVIVNRYWLPGR